MHIRLTTFFQINKFFFSHQFGFRNGCSRNYFLTNFAEVIRKALDEGKFACRVFIDFRRPLTRWTMAFFSQGLTSMV